MAEVFNKSGILQNPSNPAEYKKQADELDTQLATDIEGTDQVAMWSPLGAEITVHTNAEAGIVQKYLDQGYTLTDPNA
jgi:hypothetical protein